MQFGSYTPTEFDKQSYIEFVEKIISKNEIFVTCPKINYITKERHLKVIKEKKN